MARTKQTARNGMRGMAVRRNHPMPTMTITPTGSFLEGEANDEATVHRNKKARTSEAHAMLVETQRQERLGLNKKHADELKALQKKQMEELEKLDEKHQSKQKSLFAKTADECAYCGDKIHDNNTMTTCAECGNIKKCADCTWTTCCANDEHHVFCVFCSEKVKMCDYCGGCQTKCLEYGYCCKLNRKYSH